MCSFGKLGSSFKFLSSRLKQDTKNTSLHMIFSVLKVLKLPYIQCMPGFGLAKPPLCKSFSPLLADHIAYNS